MRLLSRVFLVLVWLSCGVAHAADAHAKRDAAWRVAIRHTLHVPDVLPALQLKTWSKFSPAQGVIAERVTYNTADGMIVPAIVYRPDVPSKKKLPGIVVVNGHGSDKFGWYAFWSGVEFARAGAVVVTYDPIGEGERNITKKSIAGSHDALPMEYGTRLAGLMQVDLMQAVTLLAQDLSVDAKRIAVVSYSMGSFVAGITGAIDPRIHAVLLSGGGVYGGAGSYFDRGNKPCQTAPYRSLANVLPVEERGEILYTLNADRGPMLVMNGIDDTVMDIPHVGPDWFAATRTKTVALHGSETNVFTTVFYPKISHRTSWVNKDGFLWLDDQIHFANWTHKQIEEAPVTHISEWAKTNGVSIAPNYMREDREGGLMAVGDGVPGFKRDDLMVLPAADWDRLKGQLVYESWAEKIEKQYAAEPVKDIEKAKASAKTNPGVLPFDFAQGRLYAALAQDDDINKSSGVER